MPILKGGPNTKECPKDKNTYCWDSHYSEYRCITPEPIYKPCSRQQHEMPAFEDKTVWECDLCGRLYIFRVYWNKYAVRGFNAEWSVKLFQRLLPWEKR